MAGSSTPLSTGDPTLAARYLADQLSEAERLDFEQRMLEDPAVLREVEATARFKAGLAQARDSGRLSMAAPRSTGRLSHLAIAAAFALFAVGIALWRTPQDASLTPWIGNSLQQFAESGGLAMPATREYRVLRLRAGNDADALIDLPPGRRAIALRVVPDSSEPGSMYSMTLVPLSGGATSQAAAGTAVEADPGGDLLLYVDSASLRVGLYRLDVAPASAPATPAESFLIRFREEEGNP